jgi:dTDP-4-dehydrorhamnose 3,5-epimerase-like enzyme
MKNTHIMTFQDRGEHEGQLVPIEAIKDVPFEIKRIYYIYGVPKNISRGFHSHRDLQQVLICVSGSLKIRIKTPYEEEIITLDNPSKGLYIGPMIWREMFDFSDHSVLLVLASEYYTENDYIRDFDAYHQEATEYFSLNKV